MLSSRQLRRLERRTKQEVMAKMRKDLMYLLKPKPKWLPKWLWIKILRRLLNLNINNTQKL